MIRFDRVFFIASVLPFVTVIVGVRFYHAYVIVQSLARVSARKRETNTIQCSSMSYHPYLMRSMVLLAWTTKIVIGVEGCMVEIRND